MKHDEDSTPHNAASGDRIDGRRRDVLKAAFAGAALASSVRGFAFSSPGRAGLIDIHHHLVPPVYRDTLAAAGIDSVGRVPLPQWSVESMFSEMDQLGIARSVLSISAPGVYFGDQAFATDLARRTNAHLADLRARHPERIGGFATLPLPDADAALAEWERAKSDGLDGVILLTNYGGKYLGHEDYAPLLDELSAQGALIFLHPTLPPGAESFGLALPPPIMEFVFDTTRTLADMIFTGALDRYSGANWVAAHLAGTLPFVAGRLGLIESSPRDAYAAFRERGRSVQSYLEQLYYDTGVSSSHASLSAVLEIVGPDRLVFGSDRPFLPMSVARHMQEDLASFPALSPGDLERIGRLNAAQLLRA